MRFRHMAGLLAAFALAGPASARAQEAIIGPQTFHGLAELSLGAADGEQSFLAGGFGKTAYSGAEDGGWKARPSLSQAVVEWRPSFAFWASGVVSGQWQADVHPRLDLDEAYLKLRSPPANWGRLSGRIGVFYPPVSLEHGGLGWTTTDLISASALNSWIGEEVKVGAAEVSFTHRFGGHEVTATGAAFGWNDTSGTLVSFRGWAIHGLRTGPSSEFELPPMAPFIARKQADETYPMWEIDGRVGWYGRLEWRPPAPVTLDALYYDNRGDRTSVDQHQWSWETRFLDLGLTADLDTRTHLKAQGLSGRTWMGYARPAQWVDVKFRAGYLMLTRDIGADAISLRAELFDARDLASLTYNDNREYGWAITAGWRHRVAGFADLMLNAQRVGSWRPSRARIPEAPVQAQDVLQAALRLHF
jgi:hypothetical protein